MVLAEWHEHADAPHALALLRVCHKWPCRRTASVKWAGSERQ
jgi:hypothetical protein